MKQRPHSLMPDYRLYNLLVLLLGTIFVSSCSPGSASSQKEQTDAPTVSVAKVENKDLSSTLVIASEFLPFQEIDIHAKVAGYVKNIYVDVGDRVDAGKLLATLEIPELQNEIQQAEASVRLSQEEIRRAEAENERAASQYEVAHLASTRLSAVSKASPGLVAQQEIDDATGRTRVAEAQVSTGKAQLAAAEQQLEVTKANQARLQTMFAYAQITAPFAGVITKRYADTGSMIQAGTASNTQAEPLVQLAQTSELRLVIPVPESIVPDIHLGTPVTVNVPALNRNFAGHVARFADQLDLTTRTMRTEVDVPNPKLELVPGLYAEASVVIKEARNALTVPIQAISRVEDRTTVFAVGKDNKIEERTVRPGIETPTDVEILSGLSENDLVVVEDRTRLHPEESVQPKLAVKTAANGGD